jgi:RNA polymerase sigma-70 factor (ECF subfamily)
MLSLTATSTQIVMPRTVAPASRPERSDDALLGAIAAGDRDAMQVLYLRHSARVYRFVVRLVGDAVLAEDIVSDVFLALWRQADSFKAKSQVSTWILAIARYKALSALRSRSEEPLDDDDAAAIADPAEDAEAIVDRQDRGMVLRRCLSQLSPIQREVLDLVYYHEKSINEVAHILAVPVGTVKTRMFGARKRMASLLAPAGLDRH